LNADPPWPSVSATITPAVALVSSPNAAIVSSAARSGGVPSFRYRVDGHRVEQTVTPHPDGPGLVQNFQLSDVEQPVWFVTGEQQSARLASPDGSIENGKLHLSPSRAETFSVSVIPTDNEASSTGDEQ